MRAVSASYSPIAPHFDLHRRRRAGCSAIDGRYLRGGFDLLAIDFQDDVARLDAGLFAGAVRLDHADQRAVRTIQAEGIGELRIHFLDRYADAAARDLAVGDELVFHIVGDIDRHRERQAHVAAGAAVDLRVDADDFALAD